MTQIILIIIGIAIIVILLTKKTREQVAGICSSALDQTVRKNSNKEKVLTLIRERKEASNSDIREALGASERSVVRYMVPKLSPKFYVLSLHYQKRKV